VLFILSWALVLRVSFWFGGYIADRMLPASSLPASLLAVVPTTLALMVMSVSAVMAGARGLPIRLRDVFWALALYFAWLVVPVVAASFGV
jgi:hypothetical protein